jgi:hypothetical protein
MAEVAEVLEREVCAAFFIEENVGDSGERGVAGDGDGGERRWRLEVGVDGEDAVDSAGAQERGVGFDEVFAVAVVDGEVEVVLAHEQVSDAGEDLGVVAFTELGEKDSDGLHALALEVSGDHGGLVIEFFGGGFNAGACGLGYGSAGSVVEDEGDGGGAEAEIFGERLEGDVDWSSWWVRRLLHEKASV